MKKPSKKNEEPISDLEAIKRLLMFQLVREGVKQSDLAHLLGVSQSTISRLLPKGVSGKNSGTSNV